MLSKLITMNDDRMGSSDVWPSFLKVNVDNLFSEHVLCTKCETVLKWKSRDGTSGLKVRMKSCVRKTKFSASVKK